MSGTSRDDSGPHATNIRLAENCYRILFERSPDAVIVTAPDGAILDFNRAALNFFGFSRTAGQPANIHAFYADNSDHERLVDGLNRTGLVHDLPARFVDRHHTVRHCLLTSMRLDTSDGQVNGCLSIIRDNTVSRLSEKKLFNQKRYAEQLIDIAPEAIAILDFNDAVIRVNEEFCRLFQYSQGECIGRPVADLTVPGHLQTEGLTLSARVKAGASVEVETQRRRKDDTLVDVSILAKPITTEDGDPAIYVFYRNITERHKKDAELRFVAYHDSLTGLPNRKSFYMHLEDLLQRETRRRSDRSWALLFLDLDKFKQINDTLGHDTGDWLLRSVADRLKSCLRHSDHLFRLGGDEFTIILTDLDRDTDVARVARKILKSIKKPFFLNGHEIFTSASIGMSLFPNDGWDAEGLVKNADMAMYAAKDDGGNGYRFFTEEMNAKALYRMKMENSLRRSLERGELRLHYQPVVNRADRIVGMEALLRWDHPELGLIMPDDFIRIGEETGMIIDMGRWVLETACAQVRQWHDMGFSELFVSINLTARQLLDPDFEEMISGILVRTGLPPHCLNLEVTESHMVQHPNTCTARIKTLRAVGVTFSIDDFGTGYSSLSYLKRFPIDSLKIDRSFITDALRSKGDREILKTIITMAHHLNIDAVAEGVETKEQKDFLLRHGCKNLQGFLFAPPLPGEQCVDVLRCRAHLADSTGSRPSPLAPARNAGGTPTPIHR